MLEPLFGFLDKMPLISSLIVLVPGVMSCYISSGIEAKMRLFRRKISNSALWIALYISCWIAGMAWAGEVEDGMQLGSSEGSRWSC